MNKRSSKFRIVNVIALSVVMLATLASTVLGWYGAISCYSNPTADFRFKPPTIRYDDTNWAIFVQNFGVRFDYGWSPVGTMTGEPVPESLEWRTSSRFLLDILPYPYVGSLPYDYIFTMPSAKGETYSDEVTNFKALGFQYCGHWRVGPGKSLLATRDLSNASVTIPIPLLWAPWAIWTIWSEVVRWRRNRFKPNHCHYCGYDLRGIPGLSRCPECGKKAMNPSSE